LHWNAARLDARLRHVRLRLLSDEGFDVAIGGDMAEKEIRGANVTLLGWLTGRLDQTAVLGAEDVDLGGPL
ncbi:MAG: hypothetical protein LBS56_09825, partial [Propionibacteriaceae bacterium]|nr:hypothetical protein [Propionibacteriaceae bacterium]